MLFPRQYHYFWPMTAIRLDKFLLNRGFFRSREKAAEAIRQCRVLVNGKVISKPSFPVLENDEININNSETAYVSKGGYKLEKAIREFSIDFTGKTVLDAGASTGGFTDCALQHGASLVVAVDVGTGQLDATLCRHPQVTNLEKTDIRELTVDLLPIPAFDIIVADLSFISLEKVLQPLIRFCKPGGEMILLVKPQFEQEERKNLKKGIVKDEAMRKKALDKTILLIQHLVPATIAFTETDVHNPSEKNIEYLLYLKI